MKEKRSTLSYIMEWAGQRKSFYIMSVVLAVISVSCSILPYFWLGHIVNDLLDGKRNLSIYLNNLIVVAGLFIVSEICHSLSTALSHKATFTVIKNIRQMLREKIARMPLGAILEKGTGSLKNTMMERVDSIETTLAHLLPEFTSNLLAPVLIFIYLLMIDVRMAFVALIPPVLGIFFAVGLFSGYEESYTKTVDTTKVLNDIALEYVGGIEVIKAFSKTKSSYDQFVKAARDNASSYVIWMKRCAVYQAGTLTLLPYTLLSVLPIGALFVGNGSLSLADFIMCIILSLGLLTPLLTLGSFTDDLAACETIVNEIVQIFDEKEIVRPAASATLPADHSVTLKDVSFAYHDEDVLHDLSMQFKADSVNAIVGPSGSGKSTIAKLLAGFYEVKRGEILFGGVNEKDLSLSDSQKQVAYVSQDNYLFNESIRENIRQGNPSATDLEVEDIARKSGCYDMIMHLADGFDTIAGSSGGHLSGGERQRISIARAMLKDAPVIILDEATAYTDPENEAIVEEALSHLVKGKTLIMIAHRLHTIQSADRIYLINDGRLAGAGTHDELLKSSDLYQKMWTSHMASRDSDGKESL